MGLLITGLFVRASGAPSYSGQLVWNPAEDQINAAGDWAETNTTIQWEVEEIQPWTWSYTYTLNVCGKDISHFIIEASDSLNEIGEPVCMTGLEDHSFGTYSAARAGKSNPYIPASVYGIKFDLAADTEVITVSFTSDRDPIWGDFYAKGGGPKNASVAFNAGLTADDSDPAPFIFGPDSEEVTDHILVPDTIPEPAVALILYLGAAGIFLRTRRR
ncbi:MAG: hypothetical protein ACYSTL_02480 [Planctomycetota bacterium]